VVKGVIGNDEAIIFFFFSFRFAGQVLYYLSHSTSPVFVLGIFEIGSRPLNYLPGLALKILLVSASE
jgi:hypothetical protein